MRITCGHSVPPPDGSSKYPFGELPHTAKTNWLLTTEWFAPHSKNKLVVNHRVVTLLADKLMRQWLCTVYHSFANCIRQPEREEASHTFYNLDLVDIVTTDTDHSMQVQNIIFNATRCYYLANTVHGCTATLHYSKCY